MKFYRSQGWTGCERQRHGVPISLKEIVPETFEDSGAKDEKIADRGEANSYFPDALYGSKVPPRSNH